jgi:UDP-glucose 4-epimerase
MERVLVTGGGGFIGRKVVKELLRRNYEVRIFDLSERNMAGVDCDYTGTILDPYELSRAIRGCDYVIHLAAVLGVQRTDSNILECLLINIQGTVNVLEACVKERVKKIVFSSSSEVYGEQEIQPISENAPLNPKSSYAVSKIVGEQYLKAYSQRYGIAYNITRFFNVYGEDQRDDFVITRFAKNVANNLPPCVYGEGTQARSFCYVDDAARGMVDALFSSVEGETFNIGNDSEPISIKDLAHKMIKISAKPLEPRFVPYDDSDRQSGRDVIKRVPSLEKAKQMLAYRPIVSLDEGLRIILRFHGVQRSEEYSLRPSTRRAGRYSRSSRSSGL